MRLHERQRVGERVGVDAPRRLAPEQPRRRASRTASATNARASIDSTSPCSPYVAASRALPSTAAGGVREVVREHLVLVERARPRCARRRSPHARGARGGIDDLGGAVDREAAAASWSVMARESLPTTRSRASGGQVTGGVVGAGGCVVAGRSVDGWRGLGRRRRARRRGRRRCGLEGAAAEEPEPDELPDPDVALGATCVLPSVSMACLVAPSTFCSVTAHSRVDELVHLAREVVGSVHREVHAVAGAHGGPPCRSRRAGRRRSAVRRRVGEQLVHVDVVHLRVALRRPAGRPRSPRHGVVLLLVLQRRARRASTRCARWPMSVFIVESTCGAVLAPSSSSRRPRSSRSCR